MSVGTKFGVLAERPFRVLWIGRSASFIGDALMTVAMVFAVISVGGSAKDIGFVTAVSLLVRTGFLLVGGVISDHLPRRLVMVGTDATLAVVQATVGFLLITDRGSVPLLAVAAACYGGAAALSKPAMTGLVPQTIGSDKLQQANALISISQNTAQLVGPAASGLMVALFGAGWVYLIDAGTFLVSVVCMSVLKLEAVPRGDKRLNFFADLAEGWREMASRRWYWLTLAAHSVWNLGISAFFVLGPVIVGQGAHGPSSWGLVSTGLAVGSLAGGLIALRWQPRRPLVVGHLALSLSVFELLALIKPSPVALIVASAALGAAGMAFINDIWMATIQRMVPEHVISRVSSYEWLVSFIVAPAGFAAVGPIASSIGYGPTLVGAAVILTVPCLLVLLIPEIRSARSPAKTEPDVPEQPSAPAHADEAAVPGSHP